MIHDLYKDRPTRHHCPSAGANLYCFLIRTCNDRPTRHHCPSAGAKLYCFLIRTRNDMQLHNSLLPAVIDKFSCYMYNRQLTSRNTSKNTNMFRAIWPGCKMTAEDETCWWHLRITTEQCSQFLNNLHKNYNTSTTHESGIINRYT